MQTRNVSKYEYTKQLRFLTNLKENENSKPITYIDERNNNIHTCIHIYKDTH